MRWIETAGRATDNLVSDPRQPALEINNSQTHKDSGNAANEGLKYLAHEAPLG
jgi:hypothetical protein